MRDLAMAQIQISKDKGTEVFNEYRKTMFPWIDKAKVRDEDMHKKILSEVIKLGPLGVTPINMKPVRSRLVQRVERKASPDQVRQQNELYKKLGKTIPV